MGLINDRLSARADRFIASFQPEIPDAVKFNHPCAVSHELRYDGNGNVGLYAVLEDAKGKQRSVLLTDVELFDMRDQRDLRASVSRVFGMTPTEAGLLLRRCNLWED